jgi:hypothetical protein
MPNAANPSLAKALGRERALKRCRPADDPVVIDAVRHRTELALAHHIQRMLEGAPPLTDEQRARLLLVLSWAGRRAEGPVVPE